MWLLLWTALVTGAAGALFLLVRRLWRQAKALTREIGTAADRFGAVTARLEELEAAREPRGGGLDGVGSPAAGPQRPGRQPLR